MPGGQFCTAGANATAVHGAEARMADVNSHRLHHFLENPFRDFVRLKKASAAYLRYALVAFYPLSRAERVLKKMVVLLEVGIERESSVQTECLLCERDASKRRLTWGGMSAIGWSASGTQVNAEPWDHQ